MIVSHPFICAVPDDPAYPDAIKPSYWNAAHAIEKEAISIAGTGGQINLTAAQANAEILKITGTLIADLELVLPDGIVCSLSLENRQQGPFKTTIRQGTNSAVILWQDTITQIFATGSYAQKSAPEVFASDPDTTKLLLHFDANLTDQSPLANTINAVNSPAYSNAPYFGSNAINFASASSQYLHLADILDLSTGNDFTIEAFYKATSFAGYQCIIGQLGYAGTTDAAFTLNVNASGYTEFGFYDGSSWLYPVLTSTTQLSTTQYSHVAISRIGANLALSVNGKVDAVYSMTGKTISNSARRITIGANDSSAGSTPGNYLNGIVDALRITIGRGLYNGPAGYITRIPNNAY